MRPGAVPLVAGQTLVGALSAERGADFPITAADIATLEQLACQTAPVFELMRRNERSPGERLRDAAREHIRGWLRTDGALRRFVAAGAVLAIGALLMMPTDFKVGGHARLEGAVQRVVVAPADGFLREVHARPGDSIKAGQLLIELADQDLRLERHRWHSQMAQYETAYAAANARSDRAQSSSTILELPRRKLSSS